MDVHNLEEKKNFKKKTETIFYPILFNATNKTDATVCSEWMNRKRKQKRLRKWSQKEKCQNHAIFTYEITKPKSIVNVKQHDFWLWANLLKAAWNVLNEANAGASYSSTSDAMKCGFLLVHRKHIQPFDCEWNRAPV